MQGNNINANRSTQSSQTKRYGASRAESAGGGSRVSARRQVAQSRSSIESSRAPAQRTETEQASFVGDIETNSSSEYQSMQEKLDIVLNLLEQLIGTELSFSEIKELNNKQSSQSELVKASSFRTDSISKEVTRNGVDTSDAVQSADSQQGLYQQELSKAKDKFENSRSNSERSKARAEVNVKNRAINFWNEREEAWLDKDQYQVQKGDDSFSAFKIDFYRSQTVGLENLIDQWIRVNDDTGYARSQIAQANAQLNLVDGAEKFWRSENDFWRGEHKSEYKLGDKEAVQSVYKDIEKLQVKYEQALLAESSDSGMEVFADLEKAKLSLNQYKTNPSSEYQGDVPYLGDSINPAEEKAFSTFKIDFYGAQLLGLGNVEDQWSGIDDNFARQQLKSIEKQKEMVNDAKDFWITEEKFWDKIVKAGQPQENREEISTLLSHMTGLENLMDQWVTVNGDGSEVAFASEQIQRIQLEINSVKTKIKTLHSNF